MISGLVLLLAAFTMWEQEYSEGWLTRPRVFPNGSSFCFATYDDLQRVTCPLQSTDVVWGSLVAATWSDSPVTLHVDSEEGVRWRGALWAAVPGVSRESQQQSIRFTAPGRLEYVFNLIVCGAQLGRDRARQCMHAVAYS